MSKKPVFDQKKSGDLRFLADHLSTLISISTPQAQFWRLLRTSGWLLLLFFGLGLLVQQSLAAGKVSSDFCQDYIAAVRVLQGLSPYLPLRDWPNYHTCTVPLNYDSHPPFSILLVLPFGMLAKPSAALLWAFFLFTLYLATGALLLKTLGWWSLRGSTLFIVGSLLWSPVYISTEAQNYAQLLTFLLALGWFLSLKGKRGWAGVVVGVAGLVKIWPVVLLVNDALRWRSRFVLAGALTVILGLLASLAVLGSSAYAAYLGPVLREETPDVPHEVNVSLVGALSRPWTGFNDSSFLHLRPVLSGLSISQAVLLGEGMAAIVLLSTLAFTLWMKRRAQGDAIDALCQGLLITVSLLAFPITWNWGLMTLIVPLAMTAFALRQIARPPLWWFLMLGFNLVLLVEPEFLPFVIARRIPLVGSLIFALPTLSLLLVAVAQAQLLVWAVRSHDSSTS